ncbi:DUF4157 domain-containing protein [Sorangium sp. So ce726]|uniref:eCIS core domain-containing protein n=1 Tax=Sorangium sp. So ce726 TaxID=3133319 RepID=UPI003F626384
MALRTAAPASKGTIDRGSPSRRPHGPTRSGTLVSPAAPFAGALPGEWEPASLGETRPRRRLGDGPSPRRVALMGVSGPSERLPHLARIQGLFGAHDLSGVRAFTGARARLACNALGAEGMTFGERVAFSSRPSLRTAAHEATHVVQQRRGLRLPGGLGRAGDAFERQADAVAELVVQGRSAAPLLDRVAASSGGESGAGGAPPVQLTPIKAGSKGETAAKRGAKLFDDFTKETDALNPKVTNYANDLIANKTTYAEEKALGFVEWAKSTTQASQRYYAEWKAAENSSGGVLESAFGRSDITDPDVTVNLTGPSRKRALEVKQVDSAEVTAVDAHVEKAVEQLAKRVQTEQLGKKKYDEHAAEVFIQHDDNTWPYTATDWNKLAVAPSSAQVEAQFKKRFAKKHTTKVTANAAPTGQPIAFTFHSPLWPTTTFNF